MNVKRWVGALVLVAAAVVGVRAYAFQGAGEVKFKAFDGDKPFWQVMKTKTTQTMKVQGMSVEQVQEQTFYIKWTPKPKANDKYIVDQEIEGVEMRITIGGNEITYSSGDKNPPQNPLTDFFKALVGSKFTLTISKDLKVENVDGLDAFVNKLAATNDQLKPLLKSILTKEAIAQMSDPTFAAFPKDGKWDPKGKGWDFPTMLDMGPIGSYDTKYTFTPAGEKDNKATLTVGATMTYKPPSEKAGTGLPFVIKEGNLKADKASGTVIIDMKLGRVESTTMMVEMSGKLKINISGMETEVEINQKQDSSLNTYDAKQEPGKK